MSCTAPIQDLEALDNIKSLLDVCQDVLLERYIGSSHPRHAGGLHSISLPLALGRHNLEIWNKWIDDG